MTKPHRRGQQIGLIKAALIFGSVVSSLLGAQTVAEKDAVENSAASVPTQTVIIVIEEAPHNNNNHNNNAEQADDSAPRQARVVQPEPVVPVTNSRSS